MGIKIFSLHAVLSPKRTLAGSRLKLGSFAKVKTSAALLIALGGASGCLSAVVPTPSEQVKAAFDLSQQPARAPMAAPASDEISTPPQLNTTIPPRVDHQEIQEKTQHSSVSTTPASVSRYAPPKSSRAVAPKPAALNPDDAATLQKTPGPRADNRLLDLLEKDIDRSVETPYKRRRLEFSKEVSSHAKVKYFIDYFCNRGRASFEKILARSGRYLPMIAAVLNEEGLPEELAYLALIESAFLTHATSSQGAAGLWQFIPSTARQYGLRIDRWVDERRDPEKSTRAAAAYLKDLHNYFGRWFLATAAYNAGQGAIDRAMQKSGAKDFWTLSRKSQLSEETRNFVPKFIAVAMIATDPERYGFGDLQYELPLQYEEVEIRRSMSLASVARMAQSDVSAIRTLNPALLSHRTPPAEESFLVKLPVGTRLAFAGAYQSAFEKEPEPMRLVTHEVRKGETLFSIARRYGQDVGALMKLNGLTTARLRIGQKLEILLRSLTGGMR